MKSILTEEDQRFFEAFDKFQATPPNTNAVDLGDELDKLAVTPDLKEALVFAYKDRLEKLRSYSHSLD